MTALVLAAGGTSDNFVNLDIHLWEWGALAAFITVLLVADLLLVHRKPHDISFKEAAIESTVWISIGLAFSGVIYYIGKTSGIGPDGAHGVDVGGKAMAEYLSGFLLEKSLSVDNVFIWAVIFNYFAVPKKYQFRVLFWGIFGALVLRAIFIFAGTALMEAFTITLFVFGGILLYTAWKLAFQKDDHQVDPNTSVVLRVVRKFIPSTDQLDGQKLFTRVNGKLLATPLFAVLVMVESTDVVFAVDSVPAILSVSNETFIVFASNAFAILGLRALYFLLGGMQDKFRYLNYGLGAILGWVGVKMMITWASKQFEWPSEDFHFPTWLSLGIIIVVLFITITASLIADKKDPGGGHHGDPGGPGGPVEEKMPGPAGEGREKWAEDQGQADPVL